MTTIKKTELTQDFQTLEKLASEIWTEHYTPIIGIDQVNYMLDKFQSAEAMQKQVADGMEYYLLIHDEKAAGYFAVAKKKKSLFLSKLYVAKEFRGNGIAKLAMQFIEQRKAALACNSISLTVNKDNSNSIAAYEKMGFDKIEAIVQDIGNGYVMDDYYMEKKRK